MSESTLVQVVVLVYINVVVISNAADFSSVTYSLEIKVE